MICYKAYTCPVTLVKILLRHFSSLLEQWKSKLWLVAGSILQQFKSKRFWQKLLNVCVPLVNWHISWVQCPCSHYCLGSQHRKTCFTGPWMLQKWRETHTTKVIWVTRPATVHFSTIRYMYVSRYSCHDTIHDMIRYITTKQKGYCLVACLWAQKSVQLTSLVGSMQTLFPFEFTE